MDIDAVAPTVGQLMPIIDPPAAAEQVMASPDASPIWLLLMLSAVCMAPVLEIAVNKLTPEMDVLLLLRNRLLLMLTIPTWQVVDIPTKVCVEVNDVMELLISLLLLMLMVTVVIGELMP